MVKSQKTVEKTIKDPEIIKIFGQMVGTETPDPNIVIPKYNSIYNSVSDVLQILKSFITSPVSVLLRDNFKLAFKEISDYIAKAEELNALKLEENDKILTGEELKEINSDPEKLKAFLLNNESGYKIHNLGVNYKKLKECSTVKSLVVTARNFKIALYAEKDRTKSEKNNLDDRTNLSVDFIKNADGDYLTLLGFSSLDFKQIYYNLTDNADKYMRLFMHLIYKKSLNIVEIITSPDIDIERFSSVLVNYIDQAKTHIPRCEKAFKKIRDSVDLLTNNFGEYYKDFVSSQNPGIIIENFVSDVANDSHADLEVSRQFREIVSYFRKNMQGKIIDPNAQKMFNLISENIDILDSKIKKEATKQKDPAE